MTLLWGGRMGRRSNRPARRPEAKAVPMAAVLTMDLVISIAAGNAGSTYELLASRMAGDRDVRPDGRFWYLDGDGAGRDAARDTMALAGYVAAHRDLVPEHLYRHACKMAARKPVAWDGVHLAVRLAHTTFAHCLLPLLAEIDAIAAAEAQAAHISIDPPDRGLYRRTGHRRRDGRGRGLGRRVPMAPEPQREAAE